MGVEAATAGRYGEAERFLLRPRREGYGPTLLFLAETMDSIGFTPGLRQQPNDMQALQLYTSACRGGVAGAREAILRLKKVLDESAGRGDVVAREILRLEMPKAKAVCP
ncbi:MAG: hypothetical protein HQL41_06860 [Alphaproteobacteria bacterium]|nr:hypothetical protein [Alphaproteobacteria bacterium]